MLPYDNFPVDIETTFLMQLLNSDGEILYEDSFTLPAYYTSLEISQLQNWLVTGFDYTFPGTGKYTFVIEYSNKCCNKRYEKEIYIYDEVEMFVRENCAEYDFIICTGESFEIKVEKIIDGTFETIETITFDSYDNSVSYDKDVGITVKYIEEEGVWRMTIPETDCALAIGLPPDEVLRQSSDGIYRFTVSALNQDIGVYRSLPDPFPSFSYTFDALHICTAKRCYNALIESYVCEQEGDIRPGNKAPDTSDTSMFIALFNQLLYFYTKYDGSIYPHTIFASQSERDEYESQLLSISRIVAALLKLCCTCSNKLDFEKANDCGC